MSKSPERDAETLPLRAALHIESSGHETDLNKSKKENETMSEESKMREELKAKAAEAIDALSLEELEKVAGGGLFDILKKIGKGSWQEENP